MTVDKLYDNLNYINLEERFDDIWIKLDDYMYSGVLDTTECYIEKNLIRKNLINITLGIKKEIH